MAIVGCGPAGIGATTTAKKHGLKYIALEETTAASTIRNYPRGKFVQATPIDINEYGAFMMEGDNSKESLVKKWMEMIAATQIAIEERQEVTGIKRAGDAFEVSTSSAKAFKARFVILAIGVRGSPRKLNIPGEEQDRVFYNLIEPEGNSGFASACVTSAPALPPPTTRMGFPCITQYRELLVPRCDLGAAGHARERREDQRAAAAWAHHRVYIEPIGGNQTGQGGAGAARGAIGAATDGGSGNYSAFRKRSSWRTM